MAMDPLLATITVQLMVPLMASPVKMTLTIALRITIGQWDAQKSRSTMTMQ